MISLVQLEPPTGKLLLGKQATAKVCLIGSDSGLGIGNDPNLPVLELCVHSE